MSGVYEDDHSAHFTISFSPSVSCDLGSRGARVAATVVTPTTSPSGFPPTKNVPSRNATVSAALWTRSLAPLPFLDEPLGGDTLQLSPVK